MVGGVSDGAQDVYGALAPIYDDWQSCDGMIPFAELVRAKVDPLLRAEARRWRDAGRDEPFAFLDVACGTGTLLCRPARRSRGLAAGRRRRQPRDVADRRRASGAPAASPGAGRRSTGRCRFAGTFDAVGCFYDALNHLNDTAALERAIAAMAAVLRPGGVLVFDVTNADGFARWWRGKPQFGGDGWRLAIDMQFDAQRQLGLADVAIAMHGVPAGRFTLRERHFPRAAVLQALAAAGLVPIAEQPWAPFDGDLAGKTWWVARLDRSP